MSKIAELLSFRIIEWSERIDDLQAQILRSEDRLNRARADVDELRLLMSEAAAAIEVLTGRDSDV